VSKKKKANNLIKWYFYRFRLSGDFDKETKWWLDIFIIDQIVRKIIEKTSINSKIYLWRFHRRKGKDIAGHQFSFLCYTNQSNSDEIYKFINNTDAFKILSKNDILKEYFIEEGGKEIDGSGDRHWPEKISKSWPYFIQGASRSMVEMIKLITNDTLCSINSNNILEIEEFYQKVDKLLEYYWYEYGGHAFLHHLNGLFGYQKTKTTQTIITSF